MKICVVGAGAIGGYVGVQLARAGIDVSLVARGPNLAAIRAHGLRLQINGAELLAHVPCTEDPSLLPPQDYVILTVKAHDVPPLANSLKPLLGPNTTLVTATNGLPYWYFHGTVPFAGTTLDSIDPGGVQWRTFGPQRAIGCVVFPAAELVSPGIIRHEHGNKFPIGEPDGSMSARLRTLQELMQAAGLDAPMRDDIRDEIWLKLAGNVCFNPISALTRATIDVIASDPGTRGICAAMMEETRAVGMSLGVRMRVDTERRLSGAAAMGPHRMSMLQDLDRGKPMEVEPLVGVVSELGRLTEVPTPTVDIVLALIRQRAATAAGVAAPHAAPVSRAA